MLRILITKLILEFIEFKRHLIVSTLVFNPVSILTEEIPTELPPPILSPTAGK